MQGSFNVLAAQLPLGCYFVLIQSNQKSSQQTLASLPHRAFALQIRQNLGPEYFAPLFAPAVQASAKS